MCILALWFNFCRPWNVLLSCKKIENDKNNIKKNVCAGNTGLALKLHVGHWLIQSKAIQHQQNLLSPCLKPMSRVKEQEKKNSNKIPFFFSWRNISEWNIAGSCGPVICADCREWGLNKALQNVAVKEKSCSKLFQISFATAIFFFPSQCHFEGFPSSPSLTSGVIQSSFCHRDSSAQICSPTRW